MHIADRRTAKRQKVIRLTLPGPGDIGLAGRGLPESHTNAASS